MEYKLFSEFITLQALLKELGIIQSGGAIKSFLANHTVLFNGEDEKRRGKKIRIGDIITLPEQDLTITLLEPTPEELEDYKEAEEEKKRVAKIVKEMNQSLKSTKKTQGNKRKISNTKTRQTKSGKSTAVKFPGT
ncbi:S4 domain-containing protein YaaA [Streptococcus hongkongensis]|nr:S4 domain-containing protein YaaA [Streptococcus uberis]